jgi:2-polyprenyl-6-hydroxyphenyl methylase / 3-demethylubiquinone-9 3-methyltransferase
MNTNNPLSTAPSLNADPLELEKFSALAAKWWDPNSEFRPLHQINPLRLEWINQLVSLNGKKVLDVGCGGGILTEAMASKGATAVGIDLAEKSLKVARLHALQSGANVDYETISTEALANREPGSFDVVTCMEMLEHVPEPPSVIEACVQLVKPGGWVFFSTLNRNPKSFLFAIIGAEYVLNLLPKGTHDFNKFIKPSELARVARNAGLVERGTKGMLYNPLTKVYKLHDTDLSVNYMMAWQKPAIAA